MDLITLGLAKKYTEDSLKGAGAIKGDKGDKGDPGVAGKDGISITKTEINSNGELIITLSNNTVSNLGVVIGAKGDKGEQGPQGEAGASFPPSLPEDDGKVLRLINGSPAWSRLIDAEEVSF